jgi:ankyrin repeat protein
MIENFKFGLSLLFCVGLTGCVNYFDAYSADKVFTNPQVQALAEATKAGNISQIEALIKSGVNIDSPGKDNLTPLYWSFTYVKPNDQTKVGFKHLLELGANSLQVHEPTGLPLLHMTARADDPDYLDLVLKYGQNADINYVRESHLGYDTAMANAMAARNFNNFKTLFEAGADIETKDTYGRTIIEVASMPGTWDYVLFLLENGANYMAGNEKTAANPDELPTIVRRLENLNYWDYGEKITTRDKIVNFLEAKDVEVYAYHKVEDSRYNPRPPLPEGVIAAQKTWNSCNWDYENNDKYYQVTDYKDVNLYKDISPEKYALETEKVINLALMNLKRFTESGKTAVIEAELYGSDTDLFSNYIYEDREMKDLACVINTRQIFTPNKIAANSEPTAITKNIYVINPKSCYLKEGIDRFKEVPFAQCEDFVTDAQTYNDFVKSN